MTDDIEESKAWKALLEWESAAIDELRESEKEMRLRQKYEAAALRRGECSIKARVAEVKYKLLGGLTIK